MQNWLKQRTAELARIPVLLRRVAPAIRSAKASGTAPWLAWLEAHALNNPEGLCCELDAERLSYGEAWSRVRAYAAVLVEQGVRPADIVALIAGNSPSYLVLVLAIAYAGGAAALIHPELQGEPLAHALSSVKPRLSLVEASERDGISALSAKARGATLTFARGELEALAEGAEPLATPRADPNGDFVFIFTSGTTGLPKPCRVRHARARSAATIFGSVAFEFRASDKLYCALPLHHSSALLVGVGAALVAGVPIALRRKFSAREFAPDIARYGATATLYIGEVCRAVVRAPRFEPLPSLRVAVGNGMDDGTWLAFAERFPRAKIREFYASTEAPSAILNLTGKVGSLGHVPFERRRGFRLARLDEARHELVRDAGGRAVPCAPNEAGELLLRVHPTQNEPHGEFAGYQDEAASRARIVRDAFELGDAYFRSGDVLRRDADGYFYFVDRLGDGYRWKGENVSALEVERVLSRALEPAQVAVFGVTVPGHPGRAGFAEVECDGAFDAQRFARATRELPAHARPCFVRKVAEIELTSSFKIKKRALDLASLVGAGRESIWVKQGESYVVLDSKLWDDLCRGEKRL
ncbi:MAG TPA: AMP-binding protein [Polyangiaceae bacterium]|nr:AMP-binding protein [Polyangiaceae bacterium]